MYEYAMAKIGFKKPEIKIYATLLKLGEQSASSIAQSVKLPRTTVRTYLENLNKQRFVKVKQRGRTQIFSAEKPDQALENLKYRKMEVIEKMDEQMRAFSAVIPELNSITNENISLPKVKFYRGMTELKQMYYDSLNSETEILCFSSIQDLNYIFGKVGHYRNKRAKKRISLRYLAQDCPEEHEERKADEALYREGRLINPKLFNIKNEINIYDNKVSIITLKEERMGMLIESREFYESMKNIFEMLWAMAKPN